MKKMRFLSAVLAVLMLSSCSSAPVAEKRVVSENMPDVLNIFSPLAFQTMEKNTDQAALDAWNAQMSDTYGAKIILQTEVDFSVASGRTVDAVTTGTLTGMVELASGEIISLMETDDSPGYILPLDEYLATNKVWNSLPLEFRNRFEKDGHIWAIPKNLGTSLQVTSINTKWLKEVGAIMPTTPESLFEAAKLFVDKDANGDGQKNDYLFSTTNSYDNNVYTSFGIYQNGYNPANQYFSDPLSSSNMSKLFNLYKNMYNYGVLDLDTFFTPNNAYKTPQNYATVQTSVGAGKYGAGFALESAKGKSEDRLLEEYNQIAATYEAIPPFSSENPITYTDDGACYVLIKTTKEPGEVVNAFVDILFGSVQSNLDCTLGVSENYTLRSDKVAVRKYANEEDQTYPLYPNLTNTLDIVDRDWIVVTPVQNADLQRKLKADAAAYEQNYIKKYTAEGKLLKLPVWYNTSYNLSRVIRIREMMYYSEYPRYRTAQSYVFKAINEFNHLTVPETSSQQP